MPQHDGNRQPHDHQRRPGSSGWVTRGKSYVMTSGQGQTASRAYKSSTVA